MCRCVIRECASPITYTCSITATVPSEAPSQAPDRDREVDSIGLDLLQSGANGEPKIRTPTLTSSHPNAAGGNHRASDQRCSLETSWHLRRLGPLWLAESTARQLHSTAKIRRATASRPFRYLPHKMYESARCSIEIDSGVGTPFVHTDGNDVVGMEGHAPPAHSAVTRDQFCIDDEERCGGATIRPVFW